MLSKFLIICCIISIICAQICGITGRGYTYEEVFKLSNTFAANLRTKFKIRDGDTVAVMLSNIPEYPIVNLGILKAGGIITNILCICPAHEVQTYLTLSKAKLIVTLPEIVPIVTGASREAKLNISVIVVQINEDAVPDGTIVFKELSEDVHVDKSCLKAVKRSASDICFLAYSSGTTGAPKGVELTHRNIIANLEQNNEPLIRCYNETTLRHQDAFICVRPFSHIYGSSVLMFHKLSIGAKLVTMNMYNYNFEKYFLQTLVKQKINIVMVPSCLVPLMSSHPETTKKTFENVDLVVYGGAPLAASEIERFCDSTKRDINMKQSYGLTEASPVVALTPESLNCSAQVGFPLPNTELRIVDENLKNLGPNEIGEVLVRGPQVMRGYKNNPQADSESFTTDGWLRTGDIGAADEQGILKIIDRLKEIIKVSGYPVSPAELESLFRKHPSVIDAGVVGVTHRIKGEIPIAFIVLKPGQKCTKSELSDFLKRKTVMYNHTQEIIFVDEIPRNASGKVMRRTLKEKYCKF